MIVIKLGKSGCFGILRKFLIMSNMGEINTFLLFSKFVH